MNSKVTSSRLTSTPPPSHDAFTPPPGPARDGAKARKKTSQLRTTDQIFRDHKVILFGVAGAFTPVCDKHHLPGFLDNLDQFKAHGLDEIAVTGVNDVFVMDAWAKSAGADGKIS